MRSRKKRPRRQRVVLRSRHQEQRTKQQRAFVGRAAVLGVLGGILFLLVTRGAPFFNSFVREHQPKVDIHAPQHFAALPLDSDFPAERFWLWVPGENWRLAEVWRRRYPEIHRVTFTRLFTSGRIVISVEGRVPLVRLGPDDGRMDWVLDGEGVRFTIEKAEWPQLPSGHFASTLALRDIGHWLGSLSQIPAIWGRVVAISDDGYDNMVLSMNEGGQVIWGPPDLPSVKKRADGLVLALADAHQHLGGAALADLRFFDDGRIIVRPKSVKG